MGYLDKRILFFYAVDMARTKHIRYIDPSSVGKVLGVLYGIVGLVVGIVFATTFFMITVKSQSGVLAALAIFTLTPLAISAIYGVLAYLLGLCVAYLYNWIAKKTGGIAIEIQ